MGRGIGRSQEAHASCCAHLRVLDHRYTNGEDSGWQRLQKHRACTPSLMYAGGTSVYPFVDRRRR